MSATETTVGMANQLVAADSAPCSDCDVMIGSFPAPEVTRPVAKDGARDPEPSMDVMMSIDTPLCPAINSRPNLTARRPSWPRCGSNGGWPPS